MRRLPQIILLIGTFALGVAATFLIMQRHAGESTTASDSSAQEAKALYWYDPMVPQPHFDAPGKSPFMDMQLVPKYAGDAGAASGSVRIDPRLVQNLGVRSSKVERGALTRNVRATGTVAFDERSVAVVQSRVVGIVDKLWVRAPLTQVK